MKFLLFLGFLYLAYRWLKKYRAKLADTKKTREERLVEKKPKSPTEFGIEYYIQNQTLCVVKNEKEGGYDLYVRLGRSGKPRFEQNFTANSDGEALAKALKELQLSVI